MADKDDLRPGAVFTHYKNKDYEIITLARDEASGDEVVVYRTLYGDFGAWTRKLEKFCETITVDGKELERFKLKTPGVIARD